MKGHICAGRRIYSPQPTNKSAMEAALFAKKYVNCLVPALLKISEKKLSHDESDSEVRYEVDMALAMSTQGFAWSHALKDMLVPRDINVGRPHQQATFSVKISQNPKQKLPEVKKFRRPKRKTLRMKKEAERENKEEKIDSRLIKLRSILPGGNEMNNVDELLSEVGSYIMCLELQVNILQCLTHI